MAERHRGQTRENRKIENGKPKWRWLAQAVGFLGTLGIAAAAVMYLPFFKVQKINVVGNSYVPAEEICRIAGVYKGEHLLQVETDAAMRNLNKDLRIEQAQVHRTFPNGLEIEVEERRPVASIECEYGFLDLDHKGVVLNAYKTRRLEYVPLFTGVKVRDLYIGDEVKSTEVLSALTFLKALDEDSRRHLQEVALADPEHVVAYTANAVQVRVGSLERLEEKAAQTQDFLQELKVTRYPMEYIDLSYTKPFVKFR